MTSAIDWVYGTYNMVFIIPIIFYLEFTAFTMYCPIKRLFSNYTHPTKVGLMEKHEEMAWMIRAHFK